MNIMSELAKPFPETAIHWRIGSTNKKKVQRETKNPNAAATKGIPLAYVDARDVMDRLDLIVGPESWQARYPFIGCCEIGIKVNGEWVWKSNGAGTTQVEAEKGQYSDAFKRAAVMWGIGRYLYGLPNTWVDLDARGYGFKDTPKLPQWATPGGWNRITPSVKKEVYEQVVTALECGDGPSINKIIGEFDQEEQVQLWPLFDSKQRAAIKVLKADA